MTGGGLPRYLENKAAAMKAAGASLESGDASRERISAECSATDLTGVRRIRIRDFELLSDSGPAFGGFGLGPSSPELLLGVISSCLTHTYLIGAALRGIALESVNVRVTAENNDARFLGRETADPDVPFDIQVFVSVQGTGGDEEIDALHRYVEQSCPLTKILRQPQDLTIHTRAAGG